MTETLPKNKGPDKKDDKRYWLDDMNNVYKIFWALVVVCALLFVADAFYHKHVVYEFENWFGFFGLFGFTVSFALVLTARELRKLLMRDEDFYDR
ncbi:MAG: hypothetical protein HOK06_04065 [Rhodospirillaceae bacterium]|jgi:hypothetical protein|nr:hypothetical protein [Rhodospirillaceae bacterium]MBT4219346.1 hypothetical protein [Rhodospirillaceae bacterium]MBT4463767.1 hypothetical protein [Rhodospirillaceae bacterium]MBT5014196.1 hypothetical protein [Rhodospirillaceae bacterium]MBT5308608.1 hypothetical protein [Rhodospirillaceae bacterium]